MSRRWTGRATVVLIVVVWAAVAVRAESWVGLGRASGRVIDAAGKPVAGARVTLRFGAAKDGPPPVVTDGKGKWSVLGLAGGEWGLTVEKDGFITATGALGVTEEGPGVALNVELRPITEISSGGTEGNPQVVLTWLTKGNSLLAQGHPREARQEYERALGALPEAERPQVLRAIARTHYLEHNLTAALVALERAAALAPGDVETHGLLVALEAEAGPQVSRAAAAQAAAEGEQDASPDRTPSLADLGFPETPLQAGRIGAFSTVLAERNPRSARDELFARTGIDLAAAEKSDPQHGRYDLKSYSFALYVPPTCEKASPCGLLVWASPTQFGGMRLERWRDLLARHRLIWVGANGCGNGGPRWIRYGLALDAVASLRRLYTIDERRVYVAGYSGGGRVASVLAVVYPEVFAGGLYMFGCDYYRPLPVPDKPGAVWPASYPRPERSSWSRARATGRYVFFTGELDFNRVQTRDTARAYQHDGFASVVYLEVPGIGHYGPVPPDSLGRALDALDPAH